MAKSKNMKKQNKKDNFLPKVARSIALAELFLERLKKKQAIPLRTLRLMELRLAAVHRLIKSAQKKRAKPQTRIRLVGSPERFERNFKSF